MLYLFPLCRTIHESIKKFPFYDENKTVCKLSIKFPCYEKNACLSKTLWALYLWNTNIICLEMPLEFIQLISCSCYFSIMFESISFQH